MRRRGRKEGKMGRAPCCNKGEVKKGAWTPEEDKTLVDYMNKNGHGTWRSFPKLAGLRRCGKSCRLRWTNYLRPDIKRGAFSFEEEQTIFHLHSLYGNKWASIASRLPGRTDNEIKNYWNSHLRKRIPNKNMYKPTDAKYNLPPTTRDVTESVMDPLLLSPATASNNFLHECGFHKVASEIPPIKFEPDSVGESCYQGVKEHIRLKEEEEAETNVSESQNSYEEESGLDITLDLLLDFPNDGEYLEYV